MDTAKSRNRKALKEGAQVVKYNLTQLIDYRNTKEAEKKFKHRIYTALHKVEKQGLFKRYPSRRWIYRTLIRQYSVPCNSYQAAYSAYIYFEWISCMLSENGKVSAPDVSRKIESLL